MASEHSAEGQGNYISTTDLLGGYFFQPGRKTRAREKYMPESAVQSENCDKGLESTVCPLRGRAQQTLGIDCRAICAEKSIAPLAANLERHYLLKQKTSAGDGFSRNRALAGSCR